MDILCSLRCSRGSQMSLLINYSLNNIHACLSWLTIAPFASGDTYLMGILSFVRNSFTQPTIELQALRELKWT
ncbi:hypothetical protein L596_004358 [Steinernema carpocapsae]|uniref:Uncharacterized protein n=1 Tax=Steinernema carpocapsae TaxID=34508 RepID=A0A4V6I833_STECR|nr:hypothetical protein L596_004358 [Steinernema carpocapsae]